MGNIYSFFCLLVTFLSTVSLQAAQLQISKEDQDLEARLKELCDRKLHYCIKDLFLQERRDYEAKISYPRYRMPLNEQESALLRAVKDSELKIVQELLAQETSPNIVDDQGLTPLMWSAMRGDTEISDSLCEAGADIHAEDSHGYNLLMQTAALTPDKIELAHLQIAAVAALVFLGSRKVDKAIIIAKSHSNEQVAHTLIYVSMRIFFDAIENNRLEEVKTAIASGVDINHLLVTPRGSITPLISAAAYDKYPHPHFSWGHSPDEWGFSRDDEDHDKIIKALLAAGAKVNAQNKCGLTALMVAAKRGNVTTVENLLAAGADASLKTTENFQTNQLLPEEQRQDACMLAGEHTKIQVVTTIKMYPHITFAHALTDILKTIFEAHIKSSAQEWAGKIIVDYLSPRTVAEAEKWAALFAQDEQKLKIEEAEQKEQPKIHYAIAKVKKTVRAVGKSMQKECVIS